ncbi:amino acid kinase family protein [Nocardia terrae]|uniref:amino acid kinase family protein n=1 Tax=Nocardia terrae TaxID=2675851 RepID=UPI0012F84B18|nr:uridylate kinase [Nocardia terrae]
MPDSEYDIAVAKFGGSCFLDLADYTAVAGYLSHSVGERPDRRVVAVVSAMSGTTGRLLEAARSIDPELRAQAQDHILATGEMVSASFLRAALDARGCPAVELWAGQNGLGSDGQATRASIVSMDARPLLDALRHHRVVVVAGGQATDSTGQVTMLGRNSSDLTAVAIAAMLGLDRCEIFSDVPGVFTADPYIVPAAELMPELGYRQCAAMSAAGAKVLHQDSVRLAETHGVRIECRALTPADAGGALVAATGTVVGVGRGRTAVVTRRRLTDGYGLVSVIDADGGAQTTVVPLPELDSLANALHARISGSSTPAARFAGEKRRSSHSDLLTRSGGPHGDGGDRT